jgi:hypothetical protein
MALGFAFWATASTALMLMAATASSGLFVYSLHEISSSEPSALAKAAPEVNCKSLAKDGRAPAPQAISFTVTEGGVDVKGTMVCPWPKLNSGVRMALCLAGALLGLTGALGYIVRVSFARKSFQFTALVVVAGHIAIAGYDGHIMAASQGQCHKLIADVNGKAAVKLACAFNKFLLLVLAEGGVALVWLVAALVALYARSKRSRVDEAQRLLKEGMSAESDLTRSRAKI